MRKWFIAFTLVGFAVLLFSSQTSAQNVYRFIIGDPEDPLGVGSYDVDLLYLRDGEPNISFGLGVMDNPQSSASRKMLVGIAWNNNAWRLCSWARTVYNGSVSQHCGISVSEGADNLEFYVGLLTPADDDWVAYVRDTNSGQLLYWRTFDDVGFYYLDYYMGWTWANTSTPVITIDLRNIYYVIEFGGNLYPVDANNWTNYVCDRSGEGKGYGWNQYDYPTFNALRYQGFTDVDASCRF